MATDVRKKSLNFAILRIYLCVFKLNDNEPSQVGVPGQKYP